MEEKVNVNLATLSNLEATIESVAAGGAQDLEDDTVITSDFDGALGVLEGNVLHLPDGQQINVVQMADSLEDGINVVQVETTELEEHDDLGLGEEDMCELDIDSEEQQHILSETGAHVIVKTESSEKKEQGPAAAAMLPQVPFSFSGQAFDARCQKLILNVWDFFRRLKKNPDLLDEIRTPQERAAAALNICAASIGKIGKNFRKRGKLEAPTRCRKRGKPILDSVDGEQEKVIRGVIKELKDNGIAPTIPLVYNECRERINFQGAPTSFRRVLYRMGFKGFFTKSFSSLTTPLPRNKPGVSSSTASPVKTATVTTPQLHSVRSVSQSEILIKTEESDRYISIPLDSPPQSSSKKKHKFGASPSKSSASAITLGSSNLKTLPISLSSQDASKIMTSLLGNNFIQLSSNSKGESFTLSQQAANTILNATSGGLGEGPQTLHVLNPENNTLQQIQIVYTNIQ